MKQAEVLGMRTYGRGVALLFLAIIVVALFIRGGDGEASQPRPSRGCQFANGCREAGSKRGSRDAWERAARGDRAGQSRASGHDCRELFGGFGSGPAGFPGMAHAQEHMMFPEARTFPPGSWKYFRDGREFRRRHATTTTQYLNRARRRPGRGHAHRRLAHAWLLTTDKLWDQERGAIEQEVAQDLSNPQNGAIPNC